MLFKNFIDTLPKDAYHTRKYELAFQKRKCPWAKHILERPEDFLFGSIENFNWCENNLIGKYHIELYCYFELEEDEFLFALKWY